MTEMPFLLVLTVRSIRNPTQPELDRLLVPLKPPEFADEYPAVAL